MNLKESKRLTDALNDSSFKTWVYRIASNLCLDKLRQSKRRALPVDLFGPARRHSSMGFHFGGVYDDVDRHESIGCTMEDGRRVDNAFVNQSNETKVI